MISHIVYTEDGSTTLYDPVMNVSYRSMHGAIAESAHIFIQAGFHFYGAKHTGPIAIAEIGFGTGLNAFLTLAEAEKMQRPVHYTAIEFSPITTLVAGLLNYAEQMQRDDLLTTFKYMHSAAWEKDISLTALFTLHKTSVSLVHFSNTWLFDIIYFDPFGPDNQPELWTKEIFTALFKMMNPGGILVTYSSKSAVRKSMQEAGFIVEKVPGPRGKREIARAHSPEK